jgi:hypothetical protein
MPFWRRDLEPVFGWWRFDRRRRALVAEGTGWRLILEGPAAADPALGIAASFHQHWLRFRALGPGVSYPLLVEARDLPRSDFAGDRPWVLRLDHLRSAALWAAETGAAGPPAEPLWRAVDRVAVDGLYAWPFDPPRQWAWLALQGGWHEGAWRAPLYRYVQRLGRGRPPPDRRFEAAAAAVPYQSWRFVAAEAALADREADAAIGLLRSLAPAAIDRAIDMLRRGRPHLARHDALAIPFLRHRHDEHAGRTEELWLLADRDMITDRLVCAREALPGGGERWRWRFDGVTALGTIDRSTGGYARLVDRGSPVEEAHHPTFPVEPGDPPVHWLRWLEELGEAGLGWRDGEVRLDDRERTGSVAVRLAAPEETAAHLHFGGGRLQWSWLVTRRSLDGGPEAAEPIAFAFLEADTIIPSADATIGRYASSADPARLRDAAAGETLTLEAVAGATPEGPLEMRFRYADAAGDYPFLVRRGPGLYGRPAWVIDHSASAALWQAEGSGRSVPPPQPLWHAATEGCIEALLHWPERAETGPLAPIVGRGGWVAGLWSDGFCRSFALQYRRFGAEPVPRGMARGAGLRWRPLQPPGAGAPLELGPDAVRDGHGGSAAAFLAAHPHAIGILREDGGAMLATGRTISRTWREDAVHRYNAWLYADADIALELHFAVDRQWELDSIGAPALLGPGGEDLVDNRASWPRPTPELWRRLLAAVEASVVLRPPDMATRLRGGPLGGGGGELLIGLWNAPPL